MKNKKSLKILRNIICFVLIFAIAFSLIYFRNSGIKKICESALEVHNAVSAENVHVTDNAALEEIASSGFTKLYFDNNTYSVAVKETKGKKIWYSIPKDEEVKQASVFSLTVKTGNDIYYMNSQDNSVAFGTVECKKSNNGITVSYIVAADKSTAVKKEFSLKDVAYNVTVQYTLIDGNLTVSVQVENLSGNINQFVSDFGLLEYFGAYKAAKDKDFILVPDGCGAKINTACESTAFKTAEYDVYGADLSMNKKSTAYDAVIGAFGMKQGNNAFVAVLNSGEELAKIKAQKAQSESEYNNVAAHYALNACSEENCSSNMYTEEVGICYRFLSGNNADYEAMAASCREQLIIDGIISSKTSSVNADLPFLLSVDGALKTSAWSVKYRKLTTFSQALDIVTRTKAKGINNIYLRYVGALSGGINQSDIKDADLLTCLGGKSDFNELCEYMTAQKMSLYLDVDVNSYASRLGILDAYSARTSANKVLYTSKNNSVSAIKGQTEFTRHCAGIKRLDSAVSSLVKSYKNMNLGGLCIDDVGNDLYADYNSADFSRTFVKNKIASQIPALASIGSIMVDNGNFYLLDSANFVSDIPMNTGIKESDAYTEVPFVQTVLHGTLSYAGSSVNIAADFDKDLLLKYVEYGSAPSFEAVYADDKSNLVNLNYEEMIAGAVSYYTVANKALADLQDKKISDDTEIVKGVKCVTYSNLSKIYVNYNTSEVTVNGLTIQPQSFLRVN